MLLMWIGLLFLIIFISIIISVVGRIMVPRDAEILTPDMVHVTSHSKWDSTDVMVLRILRWKIILDFLRGPKIFISGPSEKEARL